MGLFRSKRRWPDPSTPKPFAAYPDLVAPAFRAVLALCQPATMTSTDRLYALYEAVRYVVAAELPGAFVECGVWKGGSVMMMAATLLSLGIRDRDIYLFDTFAGMTPPTDKDIDFRGAKAAALLARSGKEDNLAWAYSPLDEVKSNLARTGYPVERFIFVAGDVLATLPAQAPASIALLRLDTDWYESTRHELEQLFPRLVRRGALIVDDYGYFRGARQAVDEYLARQKEKYLLGRIDYTGRVLIKS